MTTTTVATPSIASLIEQFRDEALEEGRLLVAGNPGYNLYRAASLVCAMRMQEDQKVLRRVRTQAKIELADARIQAWDHTGRALGALCPNDIDHPHLF